MVLMSTYNGGQFLREQIDSILAQKGVEVRLLVRDDGSKDDTCAILSEYASAHRDIVWRQGENIGFVRSFSALVAMALESEIPADYYAFADQDDIWMPEKLSTACGVLATKDPAKPHLFTSNSMQIDAEGKETLKVGLSVRAIEEREHRLRRFDLYGKDAALLALLLGV